MPTIACIYTRHKYALSITGRVCSVLYHIYFIGVGVSSYFFILETMGFRRPQLTRMTKGVMTPTPISCEWSEPNLIIICFRESADIIA